MRAKERSRCCCSGLASRAKPIYQWNSAKSKAEHTIRYNYNMKQLILPSLTKASSNPRWPRRPCSATRNTTEASMCMPFFVAALISGGTIEAAAISCYCCWLFVLTRNGRIVTDSPLNLIPAANPPAKLKDLEIVAIAVTSNARSIGQHCDCLCRLSHALHAWTSISSSYLPDFLEFCISLYRPDYMCHALSGNVRAKETQTQLPQPKWAHQRLQKQTRRFHPNTGHAYTKSLFNYSTFPAGHTQLIHIPGRVNKICRAKKKKNSKQPTVRSQ